MGCLSSKKPKPSDNKNNNSNNVPLEDVGNGKSGKGNDGKHKNVPVASLPNKKIIVVVMTLPKKMILSSRERM